MGDDLPDLPMMHQAGLSLAPADAVEEVRQRAHHVTAAGGGRGAVREAIELMLRRSGRWDEILRRYLAQMEPNP
jgi:3-deoxy-D-manno-octulosonate 8-phosphate phosphatase (KDO 8-P phosphatase)